jgi:hypothetical protein
LIASNVLNLEWGSMICIKKKYIFQKLKEYYIVVNKFDVREREKGMCGGSWKGKAYLFWCCFL